MFDGFFVVYVLNFLCWLFWISFVFVFICSQPIWLALCLYTVCIHSLCSGYCLYWTYREILEMQWTAKVTNEEDLKCKNDGKISYSWMEIQLHTSLYMPYETPNIASTTRYRREGWKRNTKIGVEEYSTPSRGILKKGWCTIQNVGRTAQVGHKCIRSHPTCINWYA